MNERGVIRHPDRARQLRKYDGLRYGAATPTDIDFFFEIDGRAFIIGELKYGDAPICGGQRLALARLVDAIQSDTRDAIALIAEHNIHDCAVDIPAADAVVKEYRRRGEWQHPSRRLTVKDVFDAFLWKYAPGGMRRLTGCNAPQGADGGEGGTTPGNETQTPSRASQAATRQHAEGGERL